MTSPIYLVIQHWNELWISLGACLITSVILKFSWYDKLGPGDMYLEEHPPKPERIERLA